MPATILIFLGPEGPTPAERWVAGGRLAAALDTAASLAGLPGVDRIVLATPQRSLPEQYPRLPLTWDIDAPGETFHFGRRLGALMDKYRPAGEPPVFAYIGAGSLPLLPISALTEAVDTVGRAAAPLAITNNLHSSDWMVLNCPQAVQARPERLERDNALGWVLLTEAGVEVRGLPASAGTRLDIDTPADLLLLAQHAGAGPNLARYLREHPQEAGQARWRAAGQTLFTPGSQVALLGRVSSAVWQHLEAHTQAWIRVFSEERGMTASGRLAAGQVRSLIGSHLARTGPRGFFAELSEMAGAVCFDTRVVLAHQGVWPSAGDRYASDLGWVDAIQDDALRELTRAAWEAPMPVVLGGHGVVAGDLYGLVEAAGRG